MRMSFEIERERQRGNKRRRRSIAICAVLFFFLWYYIFTHCYLLLLFLYIFTSCMQKGTMTKKKIDRIWCLQHWIYFHSKRSQIFIIKLVLHNLYVRLVVRYLVTLIVTSDSHIMIACARIVLIFTYICSHNYTCNYDCLCARTY